MSVSNILSGLLDSGLDTGFLKIYYDFSGCEVNGSVINVPQNDLLDGQFTGKMFYLGDKPEEFLDYNSISGNGLLFWGGVLDTGTNQVNANYIEIQNTTGISGENFTILIDGGLKKGDALYNLCTGQDIQNGGHVHVYDRYPIFNNRNSGAYCADGFEIGLTNSNRLYFECVDPNKLTTLCSSTKTIAAGQNLWMVRYDSFNLDIGRYDIFDEEFKYNSVAVPNLVHGDVWILGSGFNSINNLSNYSGYSGDSFLGNLNKFLYFDASIDDPELESVVKNLYQGAEVSTETYETFTYATGITGSGITYITGVTGFSYITSAQSGYAQEGFLYFQPLTGNIASGESYYVIYDTVTGEGADYVSGNGAIYETIINTGAEITGITGFNILTGYTGILTGHWETIEYTEMTGVLNEVVEYFYGSGSVSGLLTGPEFTYEIDYPLHLWPKSRTYLLERYSPNDLVEHKTGIIQQNGIEINIDANISNSTIFPGATPFLKENNDQDLTNLFVGGIGRLSSGIVVGDEEKVIIEYVSGDSYILRDCDGNTIITHGEILEILRRAKENQYILLGDWYLTGLEVIESLPYTGEESDLVNSTYDRLETGTRYFFHITGYDGHTGISNYNIPELFMDAVMFNGQKIYSGEHFSGHFNGSYTEFRPFGWITGETGAYFTFPRYNSSSSITGLEQYDYYNKSFYPNSFVTWINGVRIHRDAFVEHDTDADLITGYESYVDNLEELI